MNLGRHPHRDGTFTFESVNAESLHNNYFGSSYIGPDNPKDYNGKDNYDYQPTWRINYYEEISRKKNKVMKKKDENYIFHHAKSEFIVFLQKIPIAI